MRGDIDEKLPVEGVEMVTETIRSYSPIEFHGVKITPITVDHGPVKPALGYRIDFGGKSVVLSGDTRYSENLLHAATGCDLLIHEVVAPEVEKRLSQMRDPAATQRVIDHHTTPEQCGNLFRLTHPKLAVYSHIVPSPTRASDLLAPTRKEYAGPLMVGEDLMIFEVGERVSVRKWKVIPSR